MRFFAARNSSFYVCIFIWLIMAGLFWLQPYMTDNFIFSRHMIPGYAAFMSGVPIESMPPMTVAAAFSQAFEMYFTWCGRFMGNLLVYLLFMLPKGAYACLAAFCSVGYLVLLHMLIAGRRWRDSLNGTRLLWLAVLLWVGLPTFGSAFFWLCVGGYIAMLGQVLFLLPYRFAFDDTNHLKTHSPLLCVAFFICGILTASLDYPTCIALPVASFLCTGWLYLRQPQPSRKIPWLLLCGFLGVSLGAALTLFAPGNAGRMAVTTDPEVHAWLASSWGERVLNYVLHLPEAVGRLAIPLLVLIWSCVVLGMRHGRQCVQALSPFCYILLLSALATVGAYLFTSWPPPRAFNTTAALLIVMAVAVADRAVPVAGYRTLHVYKLLCWVFSMVCIVGVCQTGAKMWKVHRIHAEREAIFATHKGEDVQVQPLPLRGDRHMVLGSYLTDITSTPSHWLNRAVAAFYGLKTVQLVPTPPRNFVLSAGAAFPEVHCSVQSRELVVSCRGTEPQRTPNLHIYYYGVPALVFKLPDFLCDALMNWLDRAQAGDWRLKLVPILLARADVSLDWESDGESTGTSPLWRMQPGHGLWMVKPGQGAASFDILPLVQLK